MSILFSHLVRICYAKTCCSVYASMRQHTLGSCSSHVQHAWIAPRKARFSQNMKIIEKSYDLEYDKHMTLGSQIWVPGPSL